MGGGEGCSQGVNESLGDLDIFVTVGNGFNHKRLPVSITF